MNEIIDDNWCPDCQLPIDVCECYDHEDRLERENEELAECVCGAYVWSEKKKRMVAVADCCCGRT